VVGIDSYDRDLGLARLRHAAKDAERVADMLATHHDGSSNWRVEVMTDAAPPDSAQPHQISRAELESALDAFFELRPGPGEELDLLFFFSGHAGGAGRARLLACDGKGYSFNDLWDRIETASHAVRSVTVILDCCTSGNLNTAPENHGMLPDKQLPLKNVSILTASMPDEKAKEHPLKGSPFAEHIVGGLRGAAADLQGYVTPLSLYAHASGAFGELDQRPTFKSLAVRPMILRRSTPLVPRERLVKLVDYFGRGGRPRKKVLTEHHEGVLSDPGFIPRAEEGRRPFTGSAAQIELDHLKAYRDAHLLKTDDGRDFWFLCMDPDPARSTVSLTDLGLYYWDLAKRGLLAGATD
jgi:hypothetical protein